MNITDENSIGTLVSVYVTSSSAVLVCEAKVAADIDYWRVYVNDIEHGFANGEDVDLDVSHMYYRVLELTRDTEYTAYVVGVSGAEESPASNTITFKTHT